MLNLKIFAIGLFATNCTFGQLDLKRAEKNKAYSITFQDSIVDPTYGITYYEKYNILIADSSRRCGRNPCYGLVQDYYPTDTILHKGTYSEGKLQSYQNFYPTGILEREIKFVNVYSAKLKLYYPSGVIKSEIHYNETNPIKWVDYFENGNIDYEEYYNRTYTRLNKKASYYNSGKLLDEQLLIKKSKLIYSFKEFYEDGVLKTEGEMRYMKDIGDYRKLGTWTHYKSNGSLDKEELFNY